jgi:hypothetical protein
MTKILYPKNIKNSVKTNFKQKLLMGNNQTLPITKIYLKGLDEKANYNSSTIKCVSK